jgi:hypothetical protein
MEVVERKTNQNAPRTGFCLSLVPNHRKAASRRKRWGLSPEIPLDLLQGERGGCEKRQLNRIIVE